MAKKLFVVFLLILVLAACGEKKEAVEQKLYIYNWAEYIPTEVYKEFEKETGIKIVEDTYSTNEELFTKLKAGGDGYDLVVPSADYYEIMMKENMLEKIDKSKISTFQNIDSSILEKMREFDPQNDYGVPYVIGPTIIAINTDFVKEYPDDYSIFEREDLRGKMTLLDDMREVMTAALAMEGYPQTVSDETAIAKAADRIKKWKENIAKFDSESFGKGYATGEFWVVQGYIDNITRELDDEMLKKTKLLLPSTGGVAYIDSFCILKKAPHKEAAHKFIEYIHRPEVYAKIADYLSCPSLNVPAREKMETDPVFDIEELKKAQILRDIHETLELQNKYWQQIML